VRLASPVDARRLGISVVHQELSLFPDLTVRANIFAGRELAGPLGLSRTRQMERESREVMREVGWRIDPAARIEALSLSERQMVEILRAVHQRADLIILDEPNSALTDRETQMLFATMERMRARGHSFLLVSHRLDEVFAVSDYVTVLRDGRHVATMPRRQLDMREAIVMMVGERGVAEATERRDRPAGFKLRPADFELRPADFELRPADFKLPPRLHPEAAGQPALRVEGLAGETFAGVRFEARKGEILGLAGLEGSGLQEILAILFGQRKAAAGRIWLNSKPYAPSNPRAAITLGVASIPADRKEDGLIMDRSVGQNAMLVALARISTRLGFVTNRRIESHARPFLARMRVRAPSISAPVTQLSGGNQQKVVLAKWLAASPTVLILNDPTRGVDVGSKREVHATVRGLAETGITVLMWSSDAAETLELCHRVLVMRAGRLVMECDPRRTTLNELLLAVVGEENEPGRLQRLQEEEEQARAELAGE
jgi:ABC-type sugar transport system ATPase subunit